ncbi:hypothetical protein BaRGS_00035272 [Batillaria attramentaria]|uniref:Uncharacterized protein n=1 Tax=Batillaria attramentaria TaxID=370345 RepID=A0ABD0JFB0_9CAEN
MNPQRKLMTSALLLVLGVGFFPMTVEGGLFTIMSIKGGSLTGSEISEAVADLNSHRIFQVMIRCTNEVEKKSRPTQ